MRKVFSVFLSFVFLLSFFPSVFGEKTLARAKEQYYSVVFNSNSIPADFAAQIKGLGGEVVYTVPDIGFAQVKAQSSDFSKIKGLTNISTANPSLSLKLPKLQRIKAAQVYPEERALWAQQWDIKRITNDGASYELGTGSHDVVVGIIDSGIDRDHPDLVKNLLPGSKNFVPAGGFQGLEPKETGDPGAFDDLDGHGTHVAGSIAANVAMVGVAPDTGIRAYRVFGTNAAEIAWILDAIVTAANDDVDIISMSLGGFNVKGQVFYVDPVTGKKENLGNNVAEFEGFKRAVKYATDKGSLVVAAAGNESLNGTNKKEVTNFLNEMYAEEGISFVGAGFEVPGSIPGVVTVSATGPNDVLANYSNYGPGFIDIAAVGGDLRLYEQYAAEGRLDEYMEKALFQQELNLSTGLNGAYFWGAGTSMATPKVSAVAALLIDKHGRMDPRELEKLLYKEAVDPVRGQEKKYFGNGHLNAYKALQ